LAAVSSLDAGSEVCGADLVDLLAQGSAHGSLQTVDFLPQSAGCPPG
jgi:hypothetical protein